MLTVANFNMHAGIDGWGRPFDAIAACATFEADVLVLEEAWTNDTEGPGSGQAEQIAAALDYEVVTCTLAKGRRARPASGRDGTLDAASWDFGPRALALRQHRTARCTRPNWRRPATNRATAGPGASPS